MNTDTVTRWFVMTHYEMKYFMECLKNENAQRLSQGDTIIEPFYPHDFFKNTGDSLSDDFARIVFLKASEGDIADMVSRQYEKPPRLRLRHYLDTNGEKAVVSDTVMQEFLQNCVKYRGQFEIIPPISSIEVQDRVKIISGPFAGHEASVVRVQLSHGAIHLDLAIEWVAGVMHIRMSDVNKNKVIILNRKSADSVRTDFIEYTQNHLLTILKHRVNREQDAVINRSDADMLTRLYRYHNHEVKNESARNHFQALMLICAHLCRYDNEEKLFRAKIEDALAKINQRSESKAATDTRAYLWIALYISTQNPVYRDAVKQYVHDYQPKSPKLRSFVSLIRKGRKV